MKLTRVIQPALTEEVEITFPVYRSNSDLFYFKLIDEKNLIQVTISEYSNTLRIERHTVICDQLFGIGSKEITKEEFENKFNETKEKLTNLIK